VGTFHFQKASPRNATAKTREIVADLITVGLRISSNGSRMSNTSRVSGGPKHLYEYKPGLQYKPDL